MKKKENKKFSGWNEMRGEEWKGFLWDNLHIARSMKYNISNWISSAKVWPNTGQLHQYRYIPGTNKRMWDSVTSALQDLRRFLPNRFYGWLSGNIRVCLCLSFCILDTRCQQKSIYMCITVSCQIIANAFLSTGTVKREHKANNILCYLIT